jgi:hypothetical protein
VVIFARLVGLALAGVSAWAAPAEEPQPGRLADLRATRAAVGGPL